MDSNLTTAFQTPPKQDREGSGDKKTADKGIRTVNSSSMATIQDDDERLLARIGYKQVRSDFSFDMSMKQQRRECRADLSRNSNVTFRSNMFFSRK